MLRRIAILLSLAVSATVAALHLQVDVRNVPVDRVAANLERELDGKPKDVGILVNLARVHAMAFAQKRDTVPSAVPMGLKPAWEITPYLGHVTSLSTRYEHDFAHPDEIAFSVEGVTFKNGAVRPTYDVLLRRTAIAR